MKRFTRITDPGRTALTAALLWLAAAAGAEAAGPGVHGRVFALDENGKLVGMVPGAQIEIQNQGGGTAAGVTAMRGGYYRAELPPGQYFYKITAEGFKDEDSGRGFALELSEGYAVYNFSLTTGEDDPESESPQQPDDEIGKIEGRVLEKTPQGELIGIGRARITLRGDDDAAGLARVTTRGPGSSPDATGRYEVSVETGSWRASVSAEGFETLVDPDPIPVEEGRSTHRDFVLARVEAEQPSDQGIQGVITLADLPNKPAGSVKPRVRIIPLVGIQSEAEALVPDHDGSYCRPLGVGRYRVAATAEGYQPARSGPRDVFAGKYTIVNLHLVPKTPSAEPEPPAGPLVFHGSVFERLPGAGGKRPLPDASVLVRKAGQSLLDVPRASSDEEGKVEIAVADAGTYTVLAQKSGYLPAGAAIRITADGENAKNILLVKKLEPSSPAAVLPVRPRVPVVPIDPKPPRVEPVPPQPPSWSRVTPLPVPGRSILPWQPPVRPQPQPQRTVPVQPTAASLTVQVLGSQAGGGFSLSMPPTLPLAGAQVKILAGGSLAASGQADRMGRFTARLRPGAYQIYVAHPNFNPHRESLSLPSMGASRRIVLAGLARQWQGQDNPASGPAAVRPTVRPSLQRKPPAVLPSSALRAWQQMQTRTTHSTNAAVTPSNGSSSQANVNRLTVDPRRLQAYGQSPAGQAASAASRKKAIRAYSLTPQVGPH